MAREEDLEQGGKEAHEAVEGESQETVEKDPATEENRRAAEQVLTEALAAIHQAIRARARLYAPAPLSHAENRLALARDHFETGAYNEARVVAQQALSSADQALGHTLNVQQTRREQQRRRRVAWVYSTLVGVGVILGIRWMVQVARHHGESLGASPSFPQPGSQLAARQGDERTPRPARASSPEKKTGAGGTSSSPSPTGGSGKISSPSSPSSASPPPKRFVQVEVARLKVREGPGKDYPSRPQPLRRGRKVGVLDEQAGWLRVDLGKGQTGWIAGRYTEEVPGP